MRKFCIAAMLIISLSICIGLACSESEDTPDRPTIPGSSTLSMDLTTFTEATLARQAYHCEHYDTAGSFVVVWAAITQYLFALPRLGFILAIIQTPEYEGDMIWSWSFPVSDTNHIYLTAEILPNDSVEWVMRVTNDGLDGFIWYDGRCDFDATGGWWRFYDPDSVATSHPVLWTDWHKIAEDTTGSLTLSIIDDASEDYGDSLHYELLGTTATVWLCDLSAARPGRWYITWDIAEDYGRIEYPEGNSGCWDEALECIDCDSIPLI